MGNNDMPPWEGDGSLYEQAKELIEVEEELQKETMEVPEDYICPIPPWEAELKASAITKAHELMSDIKQLGYSAADDSLLSEHLLDVLIDGYLYRGLEEEELKALTYVRNIHGE